jgi:ligand-binding sensor domain-containing protein/signal transduction histidine kinase
MLLLLSTALAAGGALALDSRLAVSQYHHRAWQIEDGLPQNSVQAIAQTSEGYIWLATQEGLARFDGIKFTVFDINNTPALKANNIQTLYVDRAGALWIGTEGGGLSRLADSQFTTYTTADGLADDIVESIFEDGAGRLWAGTFGGLSRFEGGKFTTYTTADGLPQNSVLALAEDREGNLWIGTEGGGLSKWDGSRFTTFTTRQGLGDDLVRSICVDRHGSLWAGTAGGLSRFKDGRLVTFRAGDGLADDNIRCVYEDREGNLWIGTDAGGLNRYTGSLFSAFTKKEGLARNSVASLYQDVEGTLWIGTYGGGLSRLKDGKFVTLTEREGLPHDNAMAIYEDSRGTTWIGTSGGLSRFEGGKFMTYTAKDGLSDETILSICEDRQNNIWVGTADGLNRLSGGRFTIYAEKDGLTDPTVLALCEDSDGSLWIGTAGGLSRLKDGKFTNYTTADGLPGNSVWALLKGGDGSLWIGTDGGGLNRLKDGVFQAYTKREGLAYDLVMALHEDADGSLWVGTSHGLSRLKGGEFTNYTTKTGLYDDAIFRILEDQNGNLWMSCNKGIFRVGKGELEDVAAGKIASVTSISYGTADGMKSRECNGGFQPAGFKSSDGRLWFPTIQGVAVIDPANIKVNELPPPVLIEGLLADGRSMSLHEQISLPPGTEKLEFKYTGLSYLAPEKVKFMYKLEGFDKHWVEAGSRREVAYTNLAPGNYSFEVKACNNDGVWSEAAAGIRFYLEPRFYQTYWFYALCLATLALIAWALYQMRIRQMSAQFSAVLAERNRIARDIHDSLAQSFVGVALQLQVVRAKLFESPQLAAQHLDLAVSLVTHSLDEARRTIRDLRSGSLERHDLAQGLLEAAKQLTAGTPIRVESKVRGQARPLPAATESNLFRIGQEAITNAIKHARAGRINIDLEYRDEHVTLSIEDDGCGFNPDDFLVVEDGHFGLVGMRERAKAMKGRIEFHSLPARGTRIVLEIPLAAEATPEELY